MPQGRNQGAEQPGAAAGRSKKGRSPAATRAGAARWRAISDAVVTRSVSTSEKLLPCAGYNSRKTRSPMRTSVALSSYQTQGSSSEKSIAFRPRRASRKGPPT